MPTGSADPWHALGVVNATDAFYEAGGGAQRLGKHVSVVELDSASHCRGDARTHALTHARTHALTHARTHALTHARTHARAHARTHARTHTRTH
eukprot:3347399-Pleurochrysis_carterae.AAC.1